MTSEERDTFNDMLCGALLCSNKCYYKSGKAQFLVNDEGIFRCNTRTSCMRVTPHTGRVSLRAIRYNYSYNNRTYDKIDPLKVSLVNKKLKKIKDELPASKMKLIKESNGAIMVEVEGEKINPNRFNNMWYRLNFEKTF
jgi:hypothetical protein